MKKMKKIFAVILSLAMILGMATVTFAAPAPTEMPHDVVKVQNVAEGCTVKAYQIVKYDLKGEFIRVNDSTPTDLEVLDAEEITDIATSITANSEIYGTPTVMDYSNGVYQANLAAGMWIVLVSGTKDVNTIYNPMIVSVNVNSDGSGSAGIVSADGRFNEDDTLYAKSSTPTVTKKVTDPAYELNDNVEFTVETDIPAYSESYTAVQYKITDQLIGGLVYNKDTVVKINGTEYVNTTTPIVYSENETKMVIDIDSDTVLANPGGKVTVTYSAKLTEEAKEALANNVNPTTNTVTLEYSNDPYDKDKTTTQDDETHHYTFGIDASVLGNSGLLHHNFIKTAEGEIKEVPDGEPIKTPGEPLAGAEFEIVKKDNDGNYVKIEGIENTLSDDQGLTKFVGLDANVTYYLHEVKAPAGYSIVEKYVPVLITAKFEEDGTLIDGWTIEIGEGDEKVTTGTYQWGVNPGEIIEVPADPDKWENPYFFENTKLANLPSTGGIGTTIFTIGGCAIMIIAAGLFFASRRKSDAK